MITKHSAVAIDVRLDIYGHDLTYIRYKVEAPWVFVARRRDLFSEHVLQVCIVTLTKQLQKSKDTDSGREVFLLGALFKLFDRDGFV